MDEKDVYRTAQILIHSYGDEARSRALRNAQQMLSRNDRQGAAVWLFVSRAVEALQDTDPASEHVH